ncbi:MAG: succinate--CoA ligase subunit alpha [Candidatus Saccharimonadales bacterium]
MQLLEHQAKALLRTSGIATPDSYLIDRSAKPEQSTITYPVVLKSQVPVGGRGKLGGIKLVANDNEFRPALSSINHLEIKGFVPSSILVEEALAIDREMYLALRINRDRRRIEWLVSTQGGIDIEDNAASVKIISQTKNDTTYETICDSLSLQRSAIDTLLRPLEKCFVDNDCLLLEINPLVLTKTHTLIAADCKMLIDDNALFRHTAIVNKHDASSIIPLGGTVGVIANGAGMAMSTMDTIYAAGGKPADFLDIGGGTGEDVFIKNLREITTMPGVSSIIINIFAGITRCDDIARGIIAAVAQIPDLVPLYIRLEGTNREEAVKLLEEARIVIQSSLAECVVLALRAAGSGTGEAESESQRSQAAPSDIVATAFEEHLSSPDASKSHPDSSRTKRSDPADDSDEMQRASWREDNRCEDVVATMSESIFANNPVIIQGITGHHGAFHTRGMLDAGTNIVAGVTPGKGGETIHDIPVYNSVAEAQKIHQATTSVIFVPARFARAAMIEALDAGITLVVCITEGIPVHDMLTVYHHAVDKKATIIGPNCPGLIIPGSHKLGIIAAHITTPGQTAIISRSGTLTYELADALTKKGIGQRIVLGIGGDPIQGMNFSEALQMCEHDPHVDRIVMVGEIGGTSEQIAAEFIKHNVTKPVYGLVVGHSLPAGQQFGHAGAIVGGLGESAKEKTDYMAEQGITMSNTLDELIGQLR